MTSKVSHKGFYCPIRWWMRGQHFAALPANDSKFGQNITHNKNSVCDISVLPEPQMLHYAFS